VTSNDIAREAGVSQPTVSRALRGDPRVAAETVALVREAARRLGYVPHAAARSLITSRAGTIAVVVADLDNPFYPQLVEELHRELGRLGYGAVLFSEGGRGPEDEGPMALMRSGQVDGTIHATATTDEDSLAALREEAGPIVLVVREVPGSERDTVVADNRGGAALAATHLAELGHTRVGRISGPADTSTAVQRDEGFEAGLREAGLGEDPSLCRAGEYSHGSGYELCRDLLGAASPPSAIFCGNDVVALGALDAARALGVEVPGELSIVGFDDIAMAGWESFDLTSVHQPLEQMAREAVRTLARRVEGEAGRPERVVFPTELVRRGTTGSAPAG